MWLLDTSTLKLNEYNPKDTGEERKGWTDPPYAILSHTWGDEEVSFNDIKHAAAKQLRGYKKIEKSCALASSQQKKLIWIDTCCINKSSSAELSEAVNSMYHWYRRSSVCYVYLSDFEFVPFEVGYLQSFQTHTFAKEFKKCRWFSRGWTLQELLAPYNIEFYDKHWHYIGDKIDLVSQISAATGIDPHYIVDRNSVRRASVAARMSWASRRNTTRPEDEAYCLMGLFEVNMPLLYGERHQAFLRLQHEIARRSDDESLFAWHSRSVSGRALYSGMFADQPACFVGCGHFIPIRERKLARAPNTITSKGVAVDAYYVKLLSRAFHDYLKSFLSDETRQGEYVLLPLQCASAELPEQPFTIILKKSSHEVYLRFLPWEKEVYDTWYPHNERIEATGRQPNRNGPRFLSKLERKLIYVSQPPYDLYDSSMEILPMAYSSVWIVPIQAHEKRYALKEWYVSQDCHVQPSFYDWEIRLSGKSTAFGVMMFKRVGGASFIVVLRAKFVRDCRPVVVSHVAPGSLSLGETVDACRSSVDPFPASCGALNRGIIINLTREPDRDDTHELVLEMTIQTTR